MKKILINLLKRVCLWPIRVHLRLEDGKWLLGRWSIEQEDKRLNKKGKKFETIQNELNTKQTGIESNLKTEQEEKKKVKLGQEKEHIQAKINALNNLIIENEKDQENLALKKQIHLEGRSYVGNKPTAEIKELLEEEKQNLEQQSNLDASGIEKKREAFARRREEIKEEKEGIERRRRHYELDRRSLRVWLNEKIWWWKQSKIKEEQDKLTAEEKSLLKKKKELETEEQDLERQSNLYANEKEEKIRELATQRRDIRKKKEQLLQRNYGSNPLPVMAGKPLVTGEKAQVLLALYGEICSSWRMLVDIRFKLLGLVPGITFVAIAGLFSDNPSYLITAIISILALVVTWGIRQYDKRNSDLHDDLISRGRKIEEELGIHTGHFRGRLNSKRPIQHDFALTIIYRGTFLAWILAIVVSLVLAIESFIVSNYTSQILQYFPQLQVVFPFIPSPTNTPIPTTLPSPTP